MPPTPIELTTAYRHLLRHGLRAVQFSKPSRYVVRDHLRHAFREFPASSFHAASVSRTIEFLENATKYSGLEHKILKNLLFVWWERSKLVLVQMKKNERPFRLIAYDAFDVALERFNQEMGLCLFFSKKALYQTLPKRKPSRPTLRLPSVADYTKA